MWDMVTGKCTRMLEHPDGASAGAINGIAVSPDDEVVACIHNSVCCRAVRIIDAQGMSEVSEFFAKFPTDVRFASGQPKTILVVCKYFRASAWDVKECEDPFEALHEGVHSADISPNGDAVVTASTSIMLWDRHRRLLI